MSILLYLFFCAIAVIVPLQSSKQPMLKRYHSLYADDINRHELNIFETGIGILNFLQQGQHYLNQEVPDTIPQFGTVYDFVVIGAGTAGATIAARLSEIHQAEVLLIEAGSKENFLMDIPLLVQMLQLNNDINWKYQTKSSNKYCLGMKDNKCNWPAGKVMGGSSVLNFMFATRGSAKDYDRWAEMGNEGWAYKDVLEYFKKLETIDIPELQSDTIYHGTKGPLHISYPIFHTLLAEAFLKAGKELGYPLLDYNGENMIGFSYLQTTTINGTRMSSNRAYLYPARNRRNLHVTRESRVRKVLIDRRTNRAIGVEFIKHHQIIRVFASKEVVLCAGAIGSPQLLMLSGIGPVKHLNELGINVIRDLPVGENLMDHVGFIGLSWTVDEPVSIQNEVFNPTYPYIKDFLNKRLGPFTVPGGCEALAFINTKHPKKLNGLPDIELIFFGTELKNDVVFKSIIGYNNRVNQQWTESNRSYGWNLVPMLLKPKSRGRIRLLANDINVKPEIVPNYFDHPEDVKTMIAGIKAAMSVGRTKAMEMFGSRLWNTTYSECESEYKYDSHAYWECAIRITSTTVYHYSGTCKMGPKGDPTAVVDPRLKVIGIQGLRVADGSIMPEIISGHLNIPIYMIAEKLADIIKEDWGYSDISNK